MQSKKVAIVGSGISGLAALWALKSTNHDVYLYEAEDSLGGHIKPVVFQTGEHEISVDTGFLVCIPATYPNILALFRHLNIPTMETSMAFSVSHDHESFKWVGTSRNSVFAQCYNILRPSSWRMLFDILRFNQFALDLLMEDGGGGGGGEDENEGEGPLESIDEYLERNGYSQRFRNDYLIPMTAAAWSAGPGKCPLELPVTMLVRFMYNNNLLTTSSTYPTWFTIPRGAQTFIASLLSLSPTSHIYTSTRVHSLSTNPTTDTVALRFADGRKELFDHVILATHGDQAAEIVRRGLGASRLEKKVLRGFKTTKNLAVLHSDTSLLPTRPFARASWCYVSNAPVSLTYNLTHLERHPTYPTPILLTLNPTPLPSPSLTYCSYTYSHPLYNSTAIRSLKQLCRIQNRRGVSYAGAWTGYGFHEDGFTSGVTVAVEHLGAKVPFEIVDRRFMGARKPVLGWQDYFSRAILAMVQFLVVLLSGGVGSFRKSSKGQKASGKRVQ